MGGRNILKFIAVFTFSILFGSIPAAATVWTHTLESPVYGDAITVDIGEEILTLESVTLHISGYDVVGGWSCDGMEGSFFIPEFHVVTGTFGQGLEGDEDDVWLNSYNWDDSLEGPDFDYSHDLDVSDPGFWGFLDDGPVDFAIDYYTQTMSPGGFCMHFVGEFRLDTATLTITYNESVPNDRGTWDALKALYR